MRGATLLGGVVALLMGAGMALLPGSAMAVAVSHPLEGALGEAPGEQLRGVGGIAIAETGGSGDGDVYVGQLDSALGGVITKFDEDGDYAGVQFDGSGTPQGSLSFFSTVTFASTVTGLAIDNSAGPNAADLYVADLKHNVVHRFDGSGTYLCQITGAATPSPSECNGAAGSQTPAGGFVPTGVAVDPTSGDLFVADSKGKVVNRFSASGAYLGRISDPHITNPMGIALDSTGALYLMNQASFSGGVSNVAKFSPAGTFVSLLGGIAPSGLAVDLSTDRVYASRSAGSGRIVEFDSAGAQLHAFGSSPGLTYGALGINAASGRLYVGNFASATATTSIGIHGPDTEVPVVTADPPSDVEEATATLSGQVDPDGAGDVVSCRFEYWSDPASRQSVPCLPPPPYTDPTEASVDLNDLDPSTEYEFRLLARNAGVAPYARGVNGVAEGAFTTKGPPRILEQSSGEITRSTATLRARVNPHGHETEVRFEYLAQDDFDAQGGFDGPATRLTPFSEIGDGGKPRSVGATIAALEVGATYRFRAMARSSRGTTYGAAQTFTAVPVAGIKRQWAYARPSSATLEGEINPLGLDTSCRAEYVEESEFLASGFDEARTAACLKDPGSGTGTKIVRAEAWNLRSDSAYRFRFTVSNESGTLKGQARSFKTFGIEEYAVEILDDEGNDFKQAGGHPYETVTRYRFTHNAVPAGLGSEESLAAFVRDLITEAPPGRVADTDSTPRCPGYRVDQFDCAGETQVGTVQIDFFEDGEINTAMRALFNVLAPEGKLTRFSVQNPYSQTDSSINTASGYEVKSGVFNASEEGRAIGSTIRIWGVPADPRHDSERRCPGANQGCASSAPLLPLMRNPTSCGDPLIDTVRVRTWHGPEELTATSQSPAIEGCEQVPFEPSLEFRPTTDVADSPTGLEFNIHVPQSDDPYGIASADLKNSLIVPAEGLVINPSVANGLQGCTEAQIDMDGEGPARCPDASKIGSAEINTPLVDHPLHGAIYVAEPYENEFNSLFALYIAIHDRETGVVVKLAGRIDTNPRDGQLTSSFTENPELPFEDFRLRFFAGPRAVLKTPPACGTYTTHATLTPWSHPHSGPPVEDSDSFQIAKGPNGMPCPRKEAEAPHQPGFQAGTVSPLAGAHSPFVLHLRREDGTQRFASLSLIPPPGLMGRLAGIPYCPDASIEAARSRKGVEEKASPSCPEASRVGSVTVAAGAGLAPFRAQGDAYLAGPHDGAPLSIAVIVPALGGPYDLGTIVVRSGLDVGLETAELAVATEPLPTILEGVSLNVRQISVQLDRESFILNPTSCDPMSVSGSLLSTMGQSASLHSHFQLGNCGRLGFDPNLKISVRGKTKRRAHPSLKAVLTMPKARGANIESATVEMPPSFFLDSDRIKGVCTREQFSKRECPEDSVYGYAKVFSPLLDQPLKGPVRMRSSNQRLPNLVADLEGQVRVIVASSVGSVSRGLGIKTTVENIPDVPVSRVELRMLGGRRGLLQNAADLCERPQRLRFAFEAHNGKVKRARRVVGVRCGGEARPGSRLPTAYHLMHGSPAKTVALPRQRSRVGANQP